MSDNKGFDKAIVILGVALLFLGIGVAAYVGAFGTPFASAGNNIPGWFANEIAATFMVLGFALVGVGAWELGVWKNTPPTEKVPSAQ